MLRTQNKDLNVELDQFVQTDEQIIRTLNRKNRVDTIRQKSDEEMGKSFKKLDLPSSTGR